MKFTMSSLSAGLVIRSKEVELLAMRGANVVSRVRVPIESADLTQAVRQAVAASALKLKTKKFAIAIPTDDVLIRFFTMPALPKTEWDTAVQFEARKYIPFKTELLIWDYHATQASASKQLEVVFAAIPRDAFHRIQESLAAAGVQPTIVEPRSLSLARLVEPVKGRPSNEFVCLVDVEQDAAHLAIIKNRMPYLTRDISLLPSTNLTAPGQSGGEAVQAEGGARVADAGLAEDLEAGVVDPRAKRLLSELSVSMDFFVREYPSTSIPRVLVCGDETLIGPWCRWLSDRLHCTVELGSALLNQRVQESLPLSFAAAVGLLQAAKDPKGLSLDFLKRSLVKATGVQRAPGMSIATAGGLSALLKTLKTPYAAVCASVAVGLLVALWFVGTLQVEAARRQLEQLVRSKPDVGGLSQMTEQELGPIKEKAEAQLALLKQILGQRVRTAEKLDALARSLPEGVWLTGLTLENHLDAAGKSQLRLTVNGACFLGEQGQELRAIQTFEEQIKRNPTFVRGFSTAQLDQINAQADPQQQHTYRTFQLNCNPEWQL
jgi:type IV pilus assembly protein PilM